MIYGLIVVLLLGLAVLWVVLKGQPKISDAKRAEVTGRLREIAKLLESAQDEHALVRAVMEADKLLDQALKMRGVAGSGLGERLKNGKALLGGMENEAWQAHKLRNRLAHEVDARLSLGQARMAVMDLTKVILKVLG